MNKQIDMTIQKEFEQWLKNRIRDDLAKIEELRKGLAINPAGALDWSIGAFTAAAHEKVYREVLDALERPESKATLENIHEFALNELRQRASSPKRTTSPASALIDQEITAAWADLVELVDGFIKSKG